MTHESREIEREEERPQADLLLTPEIYNNIGSLVVILNHRGQIFSYNQACQEITGLSFQEARDQYYWDLFCLKEERELYREFFMGLSLRDFPFEVESHHRNEAGQSHVILWRHTVILEKDMIQYHVLTGTDVTLHKETEQAIQEVGERYRALIHASPVAVISLDPQAEIISWSSAAEQIFGYSEKDVLGERVLAVLQDRGGTLATYLKDVLSRKSFDSIEISSSRINGRPLFLDISLAPLYGLSGEISGMVLVAKDITQRKQMEEDLRRQLQSQKLIAEISSNFVHLSFVGIEEGIYQALRLLGEFFSMDRDSLYWFSKDLQLERFYQWSSEGIEPKGDLSSLFLTLLKESGEEKSYLYIPDVTTLPSGSSTKRELLSANILSLLLIPMIRGGCIKGIFASLREERRAVWTKEDLCLLRVLAEIIFSAFTRLDAEEALKASEEYNRSIVDLIPDSIIRFNVEGEYLDIIKSSHDHLLLSKNLLGRKVSHVLPEKEGSRLLESIREAVSSDSLKVIEFSLDDAPNQLWFEARVIPSENREVMALIRDITEKKQVEGKLKEYTTQLELKRKELVDLYSQLDEEFHKARGIHEAALPESIPDVEGISIATYYQPAQKMGGDFYSVIRKGERLVIYLADVTGHGLDGAMLSLFVKNTISSYLSMAKEEEITPESIMEFLSEQYRRENYPTDYCICIYLAILHLHSNTIYYLGAGFQDYPLLSRGSKDLEELMNTGLPISSVIPWRLMNSRSESTNLTEGATLLFTTDGLTEQMQGQRVYNHRLKEVFHANRWYPPELIVSIINEDFRNFNHGLLQGDDDITFLILKMEDPREKRYAFTLESSLSALSELRTNLLEILGNKEGLEHLFLALHEITVNAIEHGNGFQTEKRVWIELKILKGHVFVAIEDEGDGFDWRKRILVPLDLLGEQERGRGLALTQLFSKEFFYNEKGNRALLLFAIEEGEGGQSLSRYVEERVD